MIHHAIVLTAGLGTRLRPLTEVRAKPAIPVGGEPMIRRIIAWLAGFGVADLVLNLHHLPETVTAVVGDGRDLGARVRYSWEQPRILGSAGGPRRAAPVLGADPFLIVNGDTLTTVDVAAVANAHAASGALVTLALVPNREHDRYGGVTLDDRGHVTGFVRRGPAAAGSYHFIGVQAAHAAAFDAVADGEAASSIGGVYDALIAGRPGAVRGFVCDVAFWDVGTPSDYWRTSMAFTSRDRVVQMDEPEPARVSRSIVWDDVVVGAGAVIDECILTDGVEVPAGASYRRAVLVRRDDAIEAVPFDPT